jgi:hypothetical protein
MDSREFLCLKQFLSYYKQANAQMSAFGPWHGAAWNFTGFGYPDNGYFRAVCNSAVVGAIVKRHEPSNPDASWERLKALVLAVVGEYRTGPKGVAGWGYWPYDVDQQRQLHPAAGFVGYPCALAAALLWDGAGARQPGFSASEKQAIRTVLRDLAERISTYHTPAYYGAIQSCGNSATEEASGDGAFLAIMSQFDRTHAASRRWLGAAQANLQWAFGNLNTRGANLGSCGVPPNDVNGHPYGYRFTSTNHLMYPHPNYGLSVVNDAAAALVPWSGQGITVGPASSRVNGITSLDTLSDAGNASLYGGSVELCYTVYNANIVFLHGCDRVAQPNVPAGCDFTFQGYTYNSRDLSHYRDFRTQSYLGRAGVSDWGFGAEFQNAAFAFTAWLDETYFPTLGSGYYNYEKLLAYQISAPGMAYLPTQHPAPGSAGPQQTGWEWGYLASSRPGSQPSDITRPLVNFFLTTAEFPPLTLNGQINTHFFLNSFSALNHAVAYLTRGEPYWPPDGAGNSTLPDFGR